MVANASSSSACSSSSGGYPGWGEQARGHSGGGEDQRPGAGPAGGPHLRLRPPVWTPFGPRPSQTGSEGHRIRVNQAFRFELDPNREKRVLLAKLVGAACFAYNWGLERCKRALEAGKPIPGLG
ncbi:MAG: helix-turn-helix domain-containing protein [Candidatus Caldarchaeum sp.]